MKLSLSAKAALLRNFSGMTDNKGYTRLPQENLVSGIDLATVEDDLRGGDGDELRMKVCAVHSSHRSLYVIQRNLIEELATA